jgi:hypothetical protein
MTVKKAIQKAKTIQSIVFHERFIPPSFPDLTSVLRNAPGTLQQRIPKHMPGSLSPSLLASPLKRTWLIILDSTSQLSRMHQSQQAITTTTIAHNTATLRYVRPPQDYAVCLELT